MMTHETRTNGAAFDRYTPEDIFDELCDVLDPERRGETLASLDVVSVDRISVDYTAPRKAAVRVVLKPTVPHCSFMVVIALSVYARLYYSLPVTTRWKLTILLEPGSHLQQAEIERQVNDKERVAAALENPSVRREIEALINPYGEEC